MKKRIRSLAILLGAALALSCVGCGTANTDTGSTAQNPPDKTDKVQQIVDSMSLEDKVAAAVSGKTGSNRRHWHGNGSR